MSDHTTPQPSAEGVSRNSVTTRSFRDEQRDLWLKVGRVALTTVGEDPKLMDILTESFAGGELPYHGLRHCVGVACRGLDASRYIALGNERSMVLAGLFHDAGHRGLSPDSHNIAIALDWWSRAGEPGGEAVARLIRSTEFPHRPSFSTDERHLRDADMLQGIVAPDMAARFEQETGATAWGPDELLPMLETQWGREVALRRRVIPRLVPHP